MLVAESEMSLNLSLLEDDLRQAHDTWAPYFLSTLSDWIQTEVLKAEETRDTDHGPSRVHNIHAHRRLIGSLCQERDLLHQAMARGHEDVVEQYLQDAIFRGDAILSGARLVSLCVKRASNIQKKLNPSG